MMKKSNAEAADYLLDLVEKDPSAPSAGRFAQAAAILRSLDVDKERAAARAEAEKAKNEQIEAGIGRSIELMAAKLMQIETAKKGTPSAAPSTEDFVRANIDRSVGNRLLSEAMKFEAMAELGHDASFGHAVSIRDAVAPKLYDTRRKRSSSLLISTAPSSSLA